LGENKYDVGRRGQIAKGTRLSYDEVTFIRDKLVEDPHVNSTALGRQMNRSQTVIQKYIRKIKDGY